MWIERANQSVAANLAVWFDLKQKNNEGTKWLKDLRQWWRRSGRELAMPVDGLSGATCAAGEHQVTWSTDKSPLQALPAGDYQLVVEAAEKSAGASCCGCRFSGRPRPPRRRRSRGSPSWAP